MQTDAQIHLITSTKVYVFFFLIEPTKKHTRSLISNYDKDDPFNLPWSSSTSSAQLDDFIGTLGVGPFPSARNDHRSTVTPFFFLLFLPVKHTASVSLEEYTVAALVGAKRA